MKRDEKVEDLIIDVARLDRDGEYFDGEIPLEALDHDLDDFLFKPTSGLRYHLFVQLLGDELLVQGSIEEDFSCMCVRCTEYFPWTASDSEVAFSLEVQENSFMDLTNELRECIILCFPSNPICQEDCKGLCPQCGTDLNKAPCSCKPADDDRWGGLDGFRTE